MTSPLFAAGLSVTFDVGGVDIMLVVKNSISDWMGFYPCSLTQIACNHYINAESLNFINRENDDQFKDRPVSKLKKYTSLRAI